MPESAPHLPGDLDLQHFLATMRRSVYLILGMGVVVGVLAFVGSQFQTTRYQATESLLYTPSDVTTANAAALDPVRAITTLVALAKTPPVLERARRTLGLKSDSSLLKTVSASGGTDNDVIEITATATQPERAAQIARAVGRAFIQWRNQSSASVIRSRISSLQQQLAQFNGKTNPSAVLAAGDLRTQIAAAQAQLANTVGDLQEVAAAQAPSSPYTPHPYRNLIVGLLAGLLLGGAVALLRDRIDRRLRTLENVEHLYGAPTLGVVPFVRSAARGKREAGVADFGTGSPLADAFRMIRTNLQLVGMPETSTLFVVSSAVAGEGKSAVSANLANALATAGKHVLAVSADLRSPALHEYFQRPNDDGLLQVLTGEESLEQAVRVISARGGKRNGQLELLASAERIADAAALFQSPAMNQLLDEARSRYDVVVVDAPPLLATADATVLAKLADAVVLVARLGVLTRNEAARALKVLHVAGIVPVGVVTVGKPTPDEPGYGYGYSSPPPEASASGSTA